MTRLLEVLLAPAEFAALDARDLSDTVCVVFDVLRATSSMLTALAHGAQSVIPAADIPEALALRARFPDALLAGERHGLRIRADLSGGTDFDLGNSPAEFAPDRVRGRRIVMTTTNGTRALRACAPARQVVVGALLNLGALVDHLRRLDPPRLLVVCSGTLEQAAFEDAIAAGALCERLLDLYPERAVADSVRLAIHAFRPYASDLAAGLAASRNGRRLLGIEELRGDVALCAARDRLSLIAALTGDGSVRRLA